ncbi:MAG: M24 family metallopeptidase [Candidatus Humimicrobiaceae bacterium]
MLFNLEVANALMEKYKIDGLLFIDPDSLSYFGYNFFFNSVKEWMLKPGGTSSHGVINFCFLPYKKKPIYILNAYNVSSLLTKEEEIGEVAVYSPFTNTDRVEKLVNDFKNPLDFKINQIFKNIFNNRLEALEYVLVKYNLKKSKIAIEQDGINVLLVDEIKNRFTCCKFFNGSEIIRLIRMIKTDDELDIMKECFSITEKAFIESLKLLKPNSNLGYLKNHFRYIIERNKAAYDHFFIIPNGLGIIEQDSYVIEENKIMGFDSGIIFDGYISDTGVTLFNGKYEKKYIEIYKKLIDIIESGIGLVRPGISCSKIYKEMVNKRNQCNLLNVIFEGHGVGRSFREYPVINGNLGNNYNNGFENISDDFTIEKNMVINFELCANYFNENSFQIEKTAIVTNNGCNNLEFQNRTEPVFI